MEEYSCVVTGQTVNLNGRSGGISLPNKAFGRLSAGDIVQMEVQSHRRATKFEGMRLVTSKTGGVLYVSFPAGWGIQPGEMVTVRMNRIMPSPDWSEDDEDAGDE